MTGSTSSLGRCPSCDAYLVFLRQPNSRALPYDVLVDPIDETYELVRESDGRPRAHVLTCPDTASWRGRLLDDPRNVGVAAVEP